MEYMLMGHGLFDVRRASAASRLDIAVIPQGTTLQFYAHTGQGLFYDAEDLDAWDRIPTYLSPLVCGEVTYNYELTSCAEFWDELLACGPTFGGRTLLRAGLELPDRIPLCAGTAQTCPPDGAVAAAGATHGCDGLLGMLQGDLHWLACSCIANGEPEVVTASMSSLPPDVLLGWHPEWMPGVEDVRAVDAVNRENIESAAEGEVMECLAGTGLLLVGQGHARGYAEYVKNIESGVLGSITVGGKPGHRHSRLHVRGVPRPLRPRVVSALARITGREVRFIAQRGRNGAIPS